ncbi:MAG TPA: hypothetical protein VKX17_15085 [Planctomycetota bacterium]|nr:hypothetical protein [Planctomycetota bacterium]
MSVATKAAPCEVRVKGKVRKGRLTAKVPLSVPDGNFEVTLKSAARKRNGMTLEELLAHPAFGMWKDREGMKDTIAYAQKVRERFNKELSGERLLK